MRTQQMNNDLEKLTHELEKIGLNKERLLHDESSDDRFAKAENTQASRDAAPVVVNTHRKQPHGSHVSSIRFKLLETKLESTLKSSLEIKEEKIAALEARLQESSNLNQQLRQELKTVSDSIFKVFHADANREGLAFFFFKHTL